MADVAANVVQFYRGPSNLLPASSQRNADSLYFTTDSHHVYLGADRLAEYTAGAGVDITDDVVSLDSLQPGDIAEIVSPLPDPLTLDLGGLSNVDLNNPSDGQALVYDASAQKWVNGYPNTPQWSTF